MSLKSTLSSTSSHQTTTTNTSESESEDTMAPTPQERAEVTVDEFRAAAQRVVEAHPYAVNPRTNGERFGSCRYRKYTEDTSEAAPSCLIGTILLDEFHETYFHNWEGRSAYHLMSDLGYTRNVCEEAWRLQQEADRADRTWAQAWEFYVAEVAS